MSTQTTNRRLMFPALGLIALCAFVHACGGSSSGGGGGAPPLPVVPPPSGFLPIDQFPDNGAINVARQPIILIRFNDSVNPATLNATTVSLTQGVTPVPSDLTNLPCSNQVELIPQAFLLQNTQYTVNLTAGLQDDDGESLTATSFSFTTTGTIDVDRPTFTVAGFAGVANPGSETNQVLLTWQDGTDPGNLASTISYRVYRSTNGCFDYSDPIAETGPGILQAIVPAPLSRTEYSFVVRAVDAGFNSSLNINTVDVTTFTSFIGNVIPIVQQFCVSCHNPVPPGQAWTNTPQITMDYTTPATVYATWVGIVPSWPAAANAGMLRVDPGDPGNSFLYNKINAAVPVAGVQMPFGQAPLSAANQDVIFDWITEGALNN